MNILILTLIFSFSEVREICRQGSVLYCTEKAVLELRLCHRCLIKTGKDYHCQRLIRYQSSKLALLIFSNTGTTRVIVDAYNPLTDFM